VGLRSGSTCCRPPNSSSMRSRASTYHSVGSSGNADRAIWPGTSSASRSKIALGMKWLKTSRYMKRFLCSVDGDAHLADRLGPLGDVGFYEGRELLRGAAAELDALRARALPELGQIHDANRFRVQLRND